MYMIGDVLCPLDHMTQLICHMVGNAVVSIGIIRKVWRQSIWITLSSDEEELRNVLEMRC